MEATAALAAVNGALTIIEALAPQVEKLVKSGQISPEDQQKLLDRVDTIRSGAAFQGPEWQQSPTTG